MIKACEDMVKSLYVHIPFCVQKCLYCDFNSYTNLNMQDSYTDALIKELNTIALNKFQTIFIGGGTPTILSLNNLEKLLKVLHKFSPNEYTFESNPGTLSLDKLKLMKEYGVNRLSIGLQAWQNDLLKGLGRIHNIDDFLKSYKSARNIGFKNINIDLMFAIPNQSLEDWSKTVHEVIKLEPEHISSYSLIIEEGTPFYKMLDEGILNITNEDMERTMYYFIQDELKKYGYEQYEISNFSKLGYECMHNLTYWKDEEYYGAGAGAHSYINKTRYSNYLGIDDYIKNVNAGNPIEFKNDISLEDELSEFMFLGLRITNGIEKRRFISRFGMDIYNIFNNEISDLINSGLLEDNGINIKLTPRGVDVSNQVFIRFLR